MWTAKNIIVGHIPEIRAKVGRDSVLLGLSGGVDSSVVAVLLHEAISDPGAQPQMSSTKPRIIVRPCSVCVTSGWN